MKDFKIYPVKEGVEVISVPAERFKTNEISVSFTVPLNAKTASSNALIIYLLSHSSSEYSNITEINKKLAMLYGASLRATVNKLGENQNMQLILSSLDDRFSIDNEKISEESVKLLLSLILKPRLDENGYFLDEDIEREKRLLIERIESENNEKRIYALRRLEEEMFKTEPFSVNAYGTVDDIKNLTKEDLKASLDYFEKSAKIQITLVGSADIQNIVSAVSDCFDTIKRDYIAPAESVFIPKAESVNTVEESQDIKQGKLVLGFRVNMKSDDEKTDAMRAFCDVFGGGPYSKLFMNVREKLSLCYYCSARYNRRKNCVIIQCGCEEENMDKAVSEILRQLEDIKNGSFKEEFEASKIGLTDTINSVLDDSLMLLMWYSNHAADEEMISPFESANSNNAVTFDEIRNCASLLSLDTIYKLTAERGEE